MFQHQLVLPQRMDLFMVALVMHYIKDLENLQSLLQESLEVKGQCMDHQSFYDFFTFNFLSLYLS